jgi:hypothetical protein
VDTRSTSWIEAVPTILFGVDMGGIRDFECLGGAALFAAENGYMYYAHAQGWFDQDEETGVLTIPVCGPYEIRALGARNILNPNPTLRCPDTWIPSQAYRKEVDDLINLKD